MSAAVPLSLITTVLLCAWVMPVIAGEPSKVSLASTRMLTGVSSLVVAGVVRDVGDRVDRDGDRGRLSRPPEVTVYVKLSVPLKSAAGV